MSASEQQSSGIPRVWRVVLIVGALALMVALALWWRAPAPEQASRPERGAEPVPVNVAPVRSRDLAVWVEALGTVTPLHTVTVRSRVDGELLQVLFEEGQEVEKGQLLARIDPRPYRIALEEALGQQQQNRALLDNARDKLERYRGLAEQNSIPRQELEDQHALVRQYEGTLAVDAARVAEARLNLAFTRIEAPIDGRLGLRRLDPGNLVSGADGDGLVVITQMEPIAVSFSVPEAELPAILEGLRAGREMPVEALDRSGSRVLARGRLQTVDNRIDTATGTIGLKAHFANDDQRLYPNQFVNVRLRVGTRPDATVIPSASVQHGSVGTYVFVVSDQNRVRLRRIEVGVDNGERVEVLSGLDPGEQVVLEGLDRLRDGGTVKVVATGDAAGDDLPGGPEA